MVEIKLVPYFEKEHLELLEKWLMDEELMKGWDIPAFEKEKVRVWAQEKDKVILMIKDSQSGEVVGFINFYDWDEGKAVASRGTLIDSKYQNMGYGKASIVASNSYAFEKMGLKRIELYVANSNEISKHITEKLGYKFDYNDDEKDRSYYYMEE